MIAASALALLAGASPALAATCTQQTDVPVTDPNTGWHWTTRWMCANSAGVTLYGDANTSTPTAYLDGTTSSFVCYRRGATHTGENGSVSNNAANSNRVANSGNAVSNNANSSATVTSDVWYYSLGDRAASGQAGRSNWGYTPASNLTGSTSADPVPGMPACPQPYSPPQHADGTSTVLFVHGYQPSGGTDCRQIWGEADGRNAKAVYRSLGFTDSQLVTIGYYTGASGDSFCDAQLPGAADKNTPIEEIANRLAWFIYNNYSRYGNSVDLVAHSMGGLIASVAVSGTQHPHEDPFNNTANNFSWPPYLYVQDVSTLNTPFQGGTWANLCGVPSNNTQCRELGTTSGYDVNGIPRPNFLQYWITPWGNPQAYYLNGRGGTDWTLIGSSEDGVVGEESALEWSNQAIVGHKVLYVGGGGVNQPLGHSDLYKDPVNGVYHQYYCDYYNISSCDESPDYCFTCPYWGNLAGWNYNSAAEAPIVVAARANWYAGGR